MDGNGRSQISFNNAFVTKGWTTWGHYDHFFNEKHHSTEKSTTYEPLEQHTAERQSTLVHVRLGYPFLGGNDPTQTATQSRGWLIEAELYHLLDNGSYLRNEILVNIRQQYSEVLQTNEPGKSPGTRLQKNLGSQ